MHNKFEGREVPEEEVIEALGFADVFEFRRWKTEQGRRIWDLEQELKTAKEDAKNFQWHGKRQQLILEKLDQFVSLFIDSATLNSFDMEQLDKLHLAVKVVTGKGVDWDHKLDSWFSEIK